jgi:hypothetical protein
MAAWYLVKHKDKFTFYLPVYPEIVHVHMFYINDCDPIFIHLQKTIKIH